MGRLFKFLFSLVIFLVILVVAAVILIPMLVDPNDYKAEIAAEVKKATGHCEYQDNGDRVQITLVNGDAYTLTRKEKKNKFKDQKGKNVNRTIRDKEKSHYYKWESKNITVFPENWKS